MFRVAVCASVVELGDTEYVSVPLPVPVAPEVNVIQPGPFSAL
jgi:hypothetical protein